MTHDIKFCRTPDRLQFLVVLNGVVIGPPVFAEQAELLRDWLGHTLNKTTQLVEALAAKDEGSRETPS